jgi:hypothetical protein
VRSRSGNILPTPAVVHAALVKSLLSHDPDLAEYEAKQHLATYEQSLRDVGIAGFSDEEATNMK